MVGRRKSTNEEAEVTASIEPDAPEIEAEVAVPEVQPPQTLYRARSSGKVRIDGVLYHYTSGRTILSEDHPLVVRLPSRFRAIGR